jgi:hypothetical protein
LTIKNGAHHADSFLPQDSDNAEGSNLKEIRAQIETYLELWMERHNKEMSNIKQALI